MRATPRITWLLLSLSFLFDGVCPDDTNSSPATSQGPAADAEAATTVKMSVNPNDGMATISTMVKTTAMVKTATTVQPVTNVDAQTMSPMSTNATQNVGVTNEQSTSAKPQITVTTNKPATTANPTQSSTKVVVMGPMMSTATAPGISIAVPSNLSNVPNVITTTVKVHSSDSTGLTTRPATVGTQESTATNQNPTVQPKLLTVPGTKAPSDTTKGTANPPVVTVQGGRTHVVVTPLVTQADKKGAAETLPTRHGPTPFETTMPPKNSKPTTTPDVQTKHPPTVDAKVWTTAPQKTATVLTTTTIAVTAAPAPALPKKFTYSLLGNQETKEEEDLAKVCKLLMPNWQNGTCTLTWRHHNGKVQFDLVEINGKVKTSQAAQYYEEITKKPSDNRTLIAILASCGALLIMIVILAVCASHHRKPYHENQQHLTEELHTVENGYHDNPTLEVMEVQPEMQEKKMALNGEFNDSWIVPMDNLLKEELPDEEDTHL